KRGSASALARFSQIGVNAVVEVSRERRDWKNAPPDNERSYGSRLQRQEDGRRMETLLQESMKEYLDEYGEEEANGGLCAVLIAGPVRDARLAELRSLPAGGDAVDELREMQGGIEESMGTLDLYHGYSEEEQMRLAIANSLKENLAKGGLHRRALAKMARHSSSSTPAAEQRYCGW
ncbi:hypothetical protein FOZ62_005244, partial [Perkinsus olseni]